MEYIHNDEIIIHLSVEDRLAILEDKVLPLLISHGILNEIDEAWVQCIKQRQERSLD